MRERSSDTRSARWGRCVLLLLGLSLAGCGGPEPQAPTVDLTVPPGAGFSTVVDSLISKDLVGSPRLFRLYARVRGDDRRIRSGRYALAPGVSWGTLLTTLTEGRVVTVPMTVPEGFRLAQIAPRIAEITQSTEAEVLALIEADSAAEYFGVPGPGLEGYLFPDTYRFAAGVPIRAVVEAMVQRYRDAWSPERRARLDSLGMTERELVTLASIIQAEARKVDEMPTIASVYHNRLREGWLLQADPTVLYALGGYRARLLFAAIDSVADSPYNTYTQAGLPPGPIGAPGDLALQAALYPANERFFYFVARADGSHVFTRTLAEHNRAVAAARRERAQGQARDRRGTP